MRKRYLCQIVLVILIASSNALFAESGQRLIFADIPQAPNFGQALMILLVEKPEEMRQPEVTRSVRVGVAPLFKGQASPWKKAPSVLVATAVLYNYDEEIQDWVQANRTPTLDRIATRAKLFGEAELMIRGLAGIYLYGQIFDDDKAVNTARYGMESMILGGMTTQIMKNSIRRPRPTGAPGDEAFNLPDIGVSFPSGHTTVAFALATVIADQYGDGNLVKPLIYGLAALTGWSRVNDNDHWASDVMFGSYVGYISARTVIRYENPPGSRAQASSLMTYQPVLRFSF